MHAMQAGVHSTLGSSPDNLVFNRDMFLNIPLIADLKEYARAEGLSVRFGVDLESASDLSCGIGVSEMAECWEKVPCTSARPHVD